MSFTFIFINTHGGIAPSNPQKDRQAVEVSYVLPSRDFTVYKFTVASPGKCGLNNLAERNAAIELLKTNPNPTISEINRVLKNTFNESIPSRINSSLKIRKNPEFPLPDTTSSRIEKSGLFEGPARLINKIFQIDDKSRLNLYSIEFLNGDFSGENCLDPNFLTSNGIDISKFDIVSTDNGINVIDEISLTDLLEILRQLGLSQIYIIDASCGVDSYVNLNPRHQRAVSRSYDPNAPTISKDKNFKRMITAERCTKCPADTSKTEWSLKNCCPAMVSNMFDTLTNTSTNSQSEMRYPVQTVMHNRNFNQNDIRLKTDGGKKNKTNKKNKKNKKNNKIKIKT